ncbi:MAG: molybdopterin converting factor subunit 1 [Gammaproteobacteria bacterium]|jgi:molybdopterin synthase sulfur carrier subunit|nr:molybdopterin converting factor subunit 1 [Gammaproteobacteria bacterium]
MQVTVKLFAGLREELGFADRTVELDESSSVADVWAVVAGDSTLPARVLTAVNMEYVTADAALQDGDEIAFFPPVTGG